jgi:hypothetical protein
MQLELLVPRTWKHPSKEFLAGWYRRIGYSVTRRGTIDESYPQLAPRLATACDFVVYHKDLKAFHQRRAHEWLAQEGVAVATACRSTARSTRSACSITVAWSIRTVRSGDTPGVGSDEALHDS